MRTFRGVFLTVITMLAGCHRELPTSPGAAPLDSSGQLYGTVFVLGSGGKCLSGATIEVLDGSAAGTRVQQGAEQCLNDGGGLHHGYRLTGLTAGKQVRIRALAPGYWEQVKVALPQPTGSDNAGLNFELFTAPNLALGFIYGTVWGPEGCLTGARIDVVDGSAAGKVFVQSALDCLGNDGSGNSYFLTDLPLGAPIRIRASLPGYQAQERLVEPRTETLLTAAYSVDFTLTKSP